MQKSQKEAADLLEDKGYSNESVAAILFFAEVGRLDPVETANKFDEGGKRVQELEADIAEHYSGLDDEEEDDDLLDEDDLEEDDEYGGNDGDPR